MKKFLLLSGAVALGFGVTLFNTKPDAVKREVASRAALRPVGAPKLYSMRETQDYINKNALDQVEYSGILIREDVDFFQDPVHIQRFFLQSHSQRIQIDPVNKEALNDLVGQEVILYGWSERKSGRPVGFVEGNPQKQSRVAQAVKYPIEVRQEKMLVVWSDFNDSTPLPVGPEWASADNIGKFLNGGVFQDYFKFLYQGKIKNTITNVVEYRFNRNCGDKQLPGHPGVEGYIDNEDINRLFSELKLNPRDYTNVSVFANCNGNSAWGIGSNVSVDGVLLSSSNMTMWPSYFKFGSPDGLVPYLPVPPDWSFLNAFIHERLHTFGIMHSNALDCGTNTTIFPCTHIEYGNPFDLMGRGIASFQINAHHLKKGSVRPESQFLTITKPGTYTIDALESTDKKAIIGAFIKIPEEQSRVFMVEHRTPMGYDLDLKDPKFKEVPKGLLLYTSINQWGSNASFNEYDFKIIDPYPTRNKLPLLPITERISMKSLLPKMPFYDPITGVRISVESPRNQQIRFKVEFLQKERVCYRAKLTDIIEPFRFVVNGEDQDPNEVVALYPNDVFNIRAVTHQIEDAICPRTYIDTVISQTSMITAWAIRREGPILLPPVFEIGREKPKPCEGKCPGGGNGSSPTIYNNFYNFDYSQLITTDMRVPEDAPAGYYELPVIYKNQAGSGQFETTLKFQIVRDAPIKPLPRKIK